MQLPSVLQVTPYNFIKLRGGLQMTAHGLMKLSEGMQVILYSVMGIVQEQVAWLPHNHNVTLHKTRQTHTDHRDNCTFAKVSSSVSPITHIKCMYDPLKPPAGSNAELSSCSKRSLIPLPAPEAAVCSGERAQAD